MTNEQIQKVSQIVLMPGVYNLTFRPEANQIWVSVYGALESVDVVGKINSLFPELKIIDDTAYVLEHTEDRVTDYHLYSNGLSISVTGWLPEIKKDSDESDPTVKNFTSDFTINEMPVEEYLKREG